MSKSKPKYEPAVKNDTSQLQNYANQNNKSPKNA